MASRRPAADPSSPAALGEELAQLDRQLVELFDRRAELAAEQAKLRIAAGGQAIDLASEAATLSAAQNAKAGKLPASAREGVFRELLSGCRALVQPIRVAYLGPEHSYSHQAAIERFGRSIELMPVATIAAVFEEVDRRQAEFGLVPIENSTDGRIVDTLGMFARLPVKICGEVPLRIHHYLLANCPRGEIREVHSKPQAISQCREWLAKHLPGVKQVENPSTTGAAELAARQPGIAAIASRQAGVSYGLSVVAAEIEDNPHNITRFAVIGHSPAPRTGKDQTALMMRIPHRPGALADIMAVFKRNRLNLTWIESFPLPGTEKEYLFFIELEGHESELRVRRALKSLTTKTDRLEVLGSFAKTQPVG